MIISKFLESKEFTATEKLLVMSLLHLYNKRPFRLSLRDAQQLVDTSYVTAQKSLKHLTDKKILSSKLERDNKPTEYAILLE